MDRMFRIDRLKGTPKCFYLLVKLVHPENPVHPV
jgi:hypothetical protein